MNILKWIKTKKRRFQGAFRVVTASKRMLPDFIIIGAQKCGTTSLYSYLAQHPDIIASFEKEVHYFDGGLSPATDNFAQGVLWYKARFPLSICKKTNPKLRTFEASPLYLYNPLAPERIASLLPDVKLIVLLRNPTERAISHYFHETRRGMEDLPIQQALDIEEARLEPVIKQKDFKNNIYIHNSYKSRGFYLEQIQYYLKYFKREQLLILNSEDFFSNPVDSLKKVYKFVGVDSDYLPDNTKPQNVADNRSNVDPSVYNYLNQVYQPHNEALYEFLGEKYSW